VARGAPWTRLCHEPTSAALEGEAQSRTLRVIYILLLKCKKLAVAREAGDDAYVPFGRRTESALIVFGSNFIAQLRRRVLVSVAT